MRAAGFAAVLAAMLASASPASADIAVSQTAQGGELRGGRLILRGVSGRVSWWHVSDANSSGTESVRRMHRRLFRPGAPVTGVLHIAGSRDSDEPTFRLSKPRYSARRRTVSYQAKPQHSQPRSSAVAHAAAPLRFGAASLSIVPDSSLASGDRGGNICEMSFANFTNEPYVQGNPIQLVSAQKFDTDEWNPAPPTSIIGLSQGAYFRSEGGLWRGCSQSTVWHFIPLCRVDRGCGPDGTFTFYVKWNWGWDAPIYGCTSSNPQFKCFNMTARGFIQWYLCPREPDPIGYCRSLGSLTQSTAPQPREAKVSEPSH
ncbi:MAG TPA: hypothetical protein VJU79_00650 [Candidatus Dormibacteraeota bacterium]|nr:hypothetical protein [Candidatus Dormibacteraeota bacterium]